MKKSVKLKAASVALLLLAGSVSSVQAQMRGGGRGGGGEVERRDYAVVASGLTAVFPAGFECEAISSPYASPTRHDGSPRRTDRNSGLHGGIDLSLKDGTPLLAVAAGEVIAKGEGGQLEGIFLWLRHAPAQTGLPYWVFTKYQHLSAVPGLEVGARVQPGEVIAHSGHSGTVSRHYGPGGYPHLHLNALYGPSAEYAMKGMYASMAQPQGAVLDDPLILYLAPLGELSEVRGLSAERRQVIIPVVDEEGVVHPQGSKTVWPVRCERKR